MHPALLIRLRPITPWRIGPDHGAMEQSAAVLHSDALFSAVCLAFQQLGWLEEWLNATANPYAAPAVRFSSCFPWQRGVLFAPPPLGLWPPPETPGGPAKLRWKGANLVPLSVIGALLRGETLDEEAWSVDAHSGCLLPAGRSPSGPFRRMRRSAAAVDRVTAGVVRPWTATCLQFAPGAGLWCAAEFATATAYAIWAPKLESAFRLLADSGLGGLRSRGFGRSRTPDFQAGVLQELLLPGIQSAAPSGPAAASRSWWLLSLFSPGPGDEVEWGGGNYALIERNGRTASPALPGQIKKTTRLVAEGSRLVARGALTGSIRDVAPEGAPHPFWRAGFAVALELPGGNVA